MKKSKPQLRVKKKRTRLRASSSKTPESTPSPAVEDQASRPSRSRGKSLPPAFQGWPRSNSDPYALEFSRNGERVAYHKFSALYAAKKFLDAVLDDREFTWVDDNTIQLPGLNSLKITAPVGSIEGIVTHSYTPLEDEWKLTTPYDGYARTLATGHWRTAQQQMEREEKTPASSPRTPRPSKEGLVSVQNICTELKMHPRDARKILRGKVEKPSAGWAFPASEVAAIKKLLTGGKKP